MLAAIPFLTYTPRVVWASKPALPPVPSVLRCVAAPIALDSCHFYAMTCQDANKGRLPEIQTLRAVHCLLRVCCESFCEPLLPALLPMQAVCEIFA